MNKGEEQRVNIQSKKETKEVKNERRAVRLDGGNEDELMSC